MAVVNGPARSVSTVERNALRTGWEIAAATAGSIREPDPISMQRLSWISAPILGTVAAILRAAGRWDFNSSERFDASDWWYRLRFHYSGALPGAQGAPSGTLGFDGLATVTDAWLNGQHLLSSDNMFVAHILHPSLRPGDNELLLRFKSLDALLQVRRPRPRWRAPMVEHQQLRWFRTTLLGRTPGWSPPAAAVGPWRPIWIETDASLTLEDPQLQTSVREGVGIITARGRLVARCDAAVQAVTLILVHAGVRLEGPLECRRTGTCVLISGELRVPNVHLWWPHTHGEPALYDARLEVQMVETEAPLTLSLGRVGFRTLSVDTIAGDFVVRINGERIFCRGACWTPPDVVALDTPCPVAKQGIEQMAAAGMNMVRVGGTMVYENDAFLDGCDACGMLLWQDFMFANMDYPDQDEPLRASITAEATQLLARLGGRPSIAVLCGNSEAEQQAAMWGTARENWSPALFHELLPKLCATHAPGIPYWPSSAHGGAFPHQPNQGTTSYYGVGAYRRTLEDARRAEVRFASECLAFANIPEEPALGPMARISSTRIHPPLWRPRVPRDLGAAWDFADVRDHYLHEVFGLDVLAVRYAEPDRYLEYSRVVTGEIMAAAFREWRRARSPCNGALIWFLRDLWPGAGWGIVDAVGEPKCAYYMLARLLQPRTVFMTDEGGNGLYVHMINEAPTDFRGTFELSLIAAYGRSVRQRAPANIPARQSIERPLMDWLEGFSDLSYAYRFGPAAYEAVRVGLLDQTGTEVAHDLHFLLGHHRMTVSELGLTATAQRLPDGNLNLELCSQRLARFVNLRVPGYRASDQYFHLCPDAPRHILMRSLGPHDEADGEVRALNAATVCQITFPT